MRILLAAILLSFSLFSEETHHPLDFELPKGEELVANPSPFLADPSALSSTLIHGHVNAVTGSFTEVCQDIVIPGVQPFIFERNYSSFGSDTGSISCGWNHNHAGVLSVEYGKRHCYVVSKGVDGQLVFSSRDDDKYQFLHPALLDKGLTNCRGQLCGRTNLKNHRIYKSGDYDRTLLTGMGCKSKYTKHNKYHYLTDTIIGSR